MKWQRSSRLAAEHYANQKRLNMARDRDTLATSKLVSAKARVDANAYVVKQYDFRSSRMATVMVICLAIFVDIVNFNKFLHIVSIWSSYADFAC